jgi:hypothetical protein
MIECALEPYRGQVCIDANLVGWVDQGLRQLYSAAVRDMRVAMPSKLVDAAWHTHITYTQDYQVFCQNVFGRFLHHTPETVMSPQALLENRTGSLYRTWQGACRTAGLDPAGVAVPALFAVDAVAQLPGAVAWIGTCGTGDCTAPPMVRCARHHLVEEIDSSCGGYGDWGGSADCGGYDGCGGDGCAGCGGD